MVQANHTILFILCRPAKMPFVYCKRRNSCVVHIFAHLHRVLDVRKFHVSENYNRNRTNRNKWHIYENISGSILGLGWGVLRF